MVKEWTKDSPEPPIDKDYTKDSIIQSPICNCRIEHATTAIVVTNRYITNCTSDIRPEKLDSVINPSQVHRRIFDAIKRIDETIVIITLDDTHINHIKDIRVGKGCNTTFYDRRLCNITKITHFSFVIESIYNVFQLIYGSK